jgi:hypothetical protein
MEGVVLTTTGEKIATPSPTELTWTFDLGKFEGQNTPLSTPKPQNATLGNEEGQRYMRPATWEKRVEEPNKMKRTARADHTDKKEKSNSKDAAEIAEINKCKPILDISKFTKPAALKKILKKDLEIQYKWHRLRELEAGNYTEIPPIFKMTKEQLANVIVPAVQRLLAGPQESVE